MHSKKILIISYYWPPSGGVGVQRWMNYSLQLKNRDWEPIVFTPENPQFEVKDLKLADKVHEIPVVKLPIWEPFNLFHKITGNRERKNVQQGLVIEKSLPAFADRLFVWIRGNLLLPDPRVFWVRKSIKFLATYLTSEDIDTIVTTGPPHSIHLIGRGLKRKTGVKWLADFRDPWSQWDVLRKLNTSALAIDIHRSLEHSVLKEADAVTTVSSRLGASFEQLGDRFVDILHNGIVLEKTLASKAKYFTIGYFGMLNELRNPGKLWQLLDQMCRESTEFASKLTIRIGGIVSESVKAEILELEQLKDRIEFLGYLQHETVLKEYQKCNVLLLLLNKSNNAEWILPVKFFEYLMAKRMILALGEKTSDLGDLMNKKAIGELLNHNDLRGIRHFIEEVFEGKSEPDLEDINNLLRSFSYHKQVVKLESILNRLHERA